MQVHFVDVLPHMNEKWTRNKSLQSSVSSHLQQRDMSLDWGFTYIVGHHLSDLVIDAHRLGLHSDPSQSLGNRARLPVPPHHVFDAAIPIHMYMGVLESSALSTANGSPP